ncbi:MAG: putative bifunctional diguanylate cyclase/phosphodiesterase [Halioglobus sp.]
MSELPDIQRRGFIEALQATVDTSIADTGSGGSASIGLMLIDIAGLSKINTLHGYSGGDLVLSESHTRLLGISKLPDTVFRISGHCFAFILPGLSNPAFVTLAVNKVVSILQGDIVLPNGAVTLEPRVGLAISANDEMSSMKLFAEAEHSLEKVKAGGELEFDQLLNKSADRPPRDEMEGKFRSALQNGDLELYLQPKIDLTTGEVSSAEALLRWLDTEGAPVLSPPATVALATQCGEDFELTRWIASQCIRTLSQWRGEFELGLAFNVQANLVNNRDILSTLNDAKAIWGVEPGKITIEITEDAILEDHETGCGNLDLIRAAGINLSIDDFGTGYSSMSYFKQIPATELKIDQSFVRTMDEDPQSLQLVKIMIDIGHQFGMRVVAEGIETKKTLEALMDLGCDYGQGYYFTKPLPREEFEQWVLARGTDVTASKSA